MGDAVVQVPDVDWMNTALVDNWNSVVMPDDEVWVVGDFAMGRFEDSIQIAKRLHGDKYLIPGNHDRCHKMVPKWRKWLAYYEAVGFTVLDSQVMTTVADQSVKVCHFPYRFTHRSDDRYSGQRPDDEGDWLIHGHCHGPDRQRGMMIEVGVDPWGGFPVSEDTIQELIAAGPNDLGGIKWGTNHPSG